MSIKMPNFRHQAKPKVKPPVELLREAARTLAQKTGGVVEGSVFTSNPGGSNLFRHTFYLRTPALNDYTYPLFYVWHDAALYPAHLLMAGGNQQTDTQDCRTDEELREQLEEVFASPITAQLVGALMAQAGE